MKAKLIDEDKGTIKIKCPAGHLHFINTKVPNQLNAQWSFNGDFEKPTFSPSIREKTGYYVNPESADKGSSHICHFTVTEGKIHFYDDCTHELKNQTLDLLEL